MQKLFGAADNAGAAVVDMAGGVAAPLDFAHNAIRRGYTIQDGTVPGSPFEKLKEIAVTVRDLTLNYHMGINVHVSDWSEATHDATTKIFTTLLSPISFFKTGEALQKLFASNVAKIAYFTSFLALNLMHFIPYVFLSAAVTGAIFLYHTAPVALLSFLGGSVLLIQLFLSYQIAIGVNRAINLVDEKADEFRIQLDKKADEFHIQLDEKGKAIEDQVNIEKIAKDFKKEMKEDLVAFVKNPTTIGVAAAVIMLYAASRNYL